MRRISALIIPFLALTLPMPTLALTLLPTCADSGNCYTCDFLVLFVNWSQLTMYGLSGMAVLMFAIGGFMWVISAGRAEMVQKGRQIMVGTVIGLLFAFLGYLIVNVTIGALLGTGFSEVKLFGTDWASFCESGLTPGGAATSCSATGVVDGAACSAGSCSDEGVCVCLSGTCVEKCVYAVAALDAASDSSDTTIEIDSTCVEDVASCSSLATEPGKKPSTTVTTQTGACKDGLVCCVTSTSSK